MASLLAIQVLFQILLRSIEVRITSLAEVKVANSFATSSLNICFMLNASGVGTQQGDTLTR